MGDSASLRVRADALYDIGRYDDALDLYVEASTRTPGDVWCRRRVAMSLHRIGRCGDAVAEARTVVADFPDDSSAHMTLGLCLFGVGQVHRALAAHQESVRLDPDWGTYHLNVAYRAVDTGDHRLAVEAANRALELDPQSSDTLCGVATIERSVGHLADAETKLKSALHIEPAHVDALTELGLLYRDMRRWDAAVDCFGRVVELDPDNTTAAKGVMYAVGERAREAGDLAGHVAAIERYVEDLCVVAPTRRRDIQRADALLAAACDALVELGAYEPALVAVDLRCDWHVVHDDERDASRRVRLAVSRAAVLRFRGSHGDAVSEALTAVELADRVPTSDRLGRWRMFDLALGELTDAHLASGRADLAVETARHIVSVWRDADTSLEQQGELAWALCKLSSCLGDAGEHDAAVAAAVESTEIRHDLADRSGTPYQHELWVNELGHVAEHLHAAGRHDEALRYSDASIELFRRIVDRQAHERPWLAEKLITHAKILDALGRTSVARDTIDEAVTTLADLPNLWRVTTSVHNDPETQIQAWLADARELQRALAGPETHT